MTMREGGSVATDETNTLISSDKVEGTSVYNRQGEKLGSIHTLMIDKISGIRCQTGSSILSPTNQRKKRWHSSCSINSRSERSE
jgi:uncharacterized protein YrrD